MTDLDARPLQTSAIRDAAGQAQLVPLLMTMTHLSGDERWITGRYGELCRLALLPEPVPPSAEERARIDDAAADILSAGHHRVPDLDDESLLRMMSAATAGAIPPEYLERLRYELAAAESRDTASDDRRQVVSRAGAPTVTVIGAGFSGIGMGLKLAEAGIDFTIIEKNDGIGGTWHENIYPECGVDTPNELYSYDDRLSAEWQGHYGLRAEILDYLKRCAGEHDVADRVEHGLEVISADYDAAASCWQLRVRASDGREHVRTSQVVISAVGALNRPYVPTIDGADTFLGEAFHTARWPEGIELAGRKIALIGSGSSGVQVSRTLGAEGASLTVFQRTPHWIRPNPRRHELRSDGERMLLRAVPCYAGWARFLTYWTQGDARYPHVLIDPDWTGPGPSEANEAARLELVEYIRRELGDRHDLFDAVCPQYPPFLKRMVVDNEWYRTLARPQVSLVSEPIDHLAPDGIVTADGRHHEVDLIIYATGFHGLRYLYPIQVRDRQGRTLEEVFGSDDDLRSYLGLTLPGFPNLFTVGGPNATAAHGGSSAVALADIHTRYIAQAVGHMADHGLAEICVKDDVATAYNEELDRDMAQMVWSLAPDVSNRFRNDTGRVVHLHPWTTLEFWRRCRTFDPADFETKPAGSNATGPTRR